MPHTIIAGVTMSGKTAFAQSVAAARVRAGGGVLVLHRPSEPWPLPRCPLVWQTPDPDAFIAKAVAARSCFLFVEMTDARTGGDRYGEKIDKADRRFHALATESRHEGHWVFFMAQRAVALHPDIRENVQSLYLFASGDDSAERMAEEFRDKALLRSAELPPWHYFEKLNRFTPAILRPPIRLSRA